MTTPVLVALIALFGTLVTALLGYAQWRKTNARSIAREDQEIARQAEAAEQEGRRIREEAEQPYLSERINALRAIRAELNQFEEALRNSAFNRLAGIEDYMEDRRMSPDDPEAPDQGFGSDQDEQAQQLRESLRLAELARGIRLTSRKYSAFLTARESELAEIFISRALEIHEKVQHNAETEAWWEMTLAQPLNASEVANAAQEMIDASAELDRELVALIKQQRKD